MSEKEEKHEEEKKLVPKTEPLPQKAVIKFDPNAKIEKDEHYTEVVQPYLSSLEGDIALLRRLPLPDDIIADMEKNIRKNYKPAR